MRFSGLLALAVAAGALAWQSQAQATPLTPGNSITLGTTTVTLIDCATCNGATMEFVAGPGPGRSFIIDAIGGGHLLTGVADITPRFEIVSPTALTSIFLPVDGSRGSTGETVRDVLGCGVGSGATNAPGSTNIALTPASVGCADETSDVFARKDIRSTGDGFINS